ncbi:MAG: alpha-amylase/4-alpha-glucanotransferase domain-containing protein, partial [Longimicrobiales bacterium]|nr:alpha-amylase/4-alpha-glucanotransferase domain-containing protein [Longimicrobiales bacterium]
VLEGWAWGGHWKGFLARYEEANRIHKRMTALSELCRDRGDPPEPRRAIGRGQCNDAYWHGVFGGLYMKHLREGVRRELMEAERLLRVGEGLDWSRRDLDGTGREGCWVHGEEVSAWMDPRYGGTITDLLWLQRGVDVVDVLTRRREEYHHEAVGRRTSPGDDESRTEGGAVEGGAVEAPTEGETVAVRSGGAAARDDSARDDAAPSGAAPSIHEIEEAAVLDRLPPVDPDVRALVRDRVLGVDLGYDDYRDGDFTAVWAPGSRASSSTDPSRPAVGDPERTVDDEGRGVLTWRFETREVRKSIAVREDGAVTIQWRWSPDAFPRGSCFAPELSLGAPVELVFDPIPEIWRYPIITVSKCPEGFEEIEQGESVTPRWPVELGSASLVVRPG